MKRRVAFEGADVRRPLPRKPRTDIVPCPACGMRVRPAARKVPHEETAECKASLVMGAYAARGWTPTLNATHTKIFREAGVPVEEALGGYHDQAYADTDDEGRVTRQWVVQEQHEIGFVPAQAHRLAMLMVRLRIAPGNRRAVLQDLWRHEDLIDAIEATARLGGLSGAFIMKMREHARERPAG